MFILIPRCVSLIHTTTANGIRIPSAVDMYAKYQYLDSLIILLPVNFMFLRKNQGEKIFFPFSIFQKNLYENIIFSIIVINQSLLHFGHS
jgi:hypothetical protein